MGERIRDAAARTLAVMLGLGIMMVIVGIYAEEGPLRDELSQFLLAILSSLIAIVGAFVGRAQPEDSLSRHWVGFILTLTLGAVVLAISMFVLLTGLIVPDVPVIGPNGQNILSAVIGGSLGVLGAYLGFEWSDRSRAEEEPEEEPEE